jgi:non-canonical purine NTP pyrophosphatase, rdgB/HAM1 family
MKAEKMQLVFATNNDHKLREIRDILGDSFNLLSLKDLNIEEDIPENEPTLEGNAMYKARHIYGILKINVFADDTGLETDLLNGLPGVYSARFAGENKNSDDNIDRLLGMMGNSENRKARFRTVIALIADGSEHFFEGISEGTIISERRGRQGFGYDPVFVPSGSNLTYAEMTLDEKNKISHRARAFNKLKEFLSLYEQKNNKDRI